MKKLISNFSHIEVSPYEKGEEPHLEKSLEVFDWVSHKVKLRCYEVEDNKLLLPRSTSITMLQYLFHCQLEKDNSMFPIKKVLFNLKAKPRDDNQHKALRFLAGVREFSKLAYSSRKNLELDTGIGKTYCAIAAVWYFKQTPIIIVHLKRLIKQWKSKILEYTDITEKEILIINGSSSIQKILGKRNKINYKFYIISHATLRSYAKTHGWNHIQSLFEILGIGITIYDEAHLEFKNIIRIDLHTNVRRKFYLTATAGRSDRGEDILYSRVLGAAPTLKIKLKQSERKNISLILKINSFPTNIEEKNIYTIRGMNSTKYLRYLFNHKARLELDKAMTLALNIVKDIEGKFIILVGLIENAEPMKEFIENTFKQWKDNIGIVNSNIKEKTQEKEQKKKIIITTFSSFGTGIDIDDINVIIMLEPYSSKIICRQLIGRLRNKGVYIEILDKGVRKRETEQFEKVKDDISECSKKVIIQDIENTTYGE